MLIKILVLIILIVVNGMFSATEMAFLSIGKYELNQDIKNQNKKAIKIGKLIANSNIFLSAIQIAITLSGFLASAFAAEGFASEIANSITIASISKETLTSILLVLITIVLSYFSLVFGELVPKQIGLAYSKKVSYAMVNVIYVIIKVFKPFIIILQVSTNLFVRILRIKKPEESAETAIKDSIVDGNLEELEKKILLRVFDFNDITVEKVCTPKEDVISIDIGATKKELLQLIKDTKFTRFPVTKKGAVVGVLNIKDLIIDKKKEFSIKKYMREITTLPHDTIIDDAFLMLNSKYQAIAEVTKNGEFIGIVTVEDITEEVIGNIFDEYDK